MKKVYKLEELDCALCGEKMASAIKKIKGIRDVSVSFISQKMIIEFNEEVSEKEVMDEVVKVCKKIEPDCTIVR